MADDLTPKPEHARLLAETFDPEQLASRSYGNEALDQLAIDRILGI